MLQTLCTLTDLPHGLGLRFKDLWSLTEQIFISLDFFGSFFIKKKELAFRWQ